MFEINQGSHNILKGEVQQNYNYFETTEGIFGIISSNTNWQMLFLLTCWMLHWLMLFPVLPELYYVLLVMFDFAFILRWTQALVSTTM